MTHFDFVLEDYEADYLMDSLNNEIRARVDYISSLVRVLGKEESAAFINEVEGQIEYLTNIKDKMQTGRKQEDIKWIQKSHTTRSTKTKADANFANL